MQAGGGRVLVDNRPSTQRMRALAQRVENGPRMLQRKAMAESFLQAPLVQQRAAMAEDFRNTPVMQQRAALAQTVLPAVQRRALADEPVQAKHSAQSAQSAEAMPDGGTLQAKSDREVADEPVMSDSPVQPKLDHATVEAKASDAAIQARAADMPASSDAVESGTSPVGEALPEAKPNRTGLPDNLKHGVETLSGLSLDNVRVHFNSPQPAQLNAHAYAQGTDIHVAPGQERHLPHEAWHVVQQAQGRVKPTMQLKSGVPVNDDAGLEREADVMGGRAMRLAPPDSLGGQKHSLPLAGEIIGCAVQQVRFSLTNSFYGDQIKPSDIAIENLALAGSIASNYQGKAEDSIFMLPFAGNGTVRIGQESYNSETHPETSFWVEVQAIDWETLGEKQLNNIEVAETTQTFFDQQTDIMRDLYNEFSQTIQANPGRPLRVASFQFSKNDDGLLITDWSLKEIEPEVAPSISSSFLNEVQGIDSLKAKVKANINQTLFSAGQFQWIARNWESISQTHDVYVDVDFYPNRMPDAGGKLHKDSVGETLFVNLTYNNTKEAAAPEYINDKFGNNDIEQNLGEAANKLIRHTRLRYGFNEGVKGVNMPKNGRVSFIDPTIWHATPYYGKRLPLPDYALFEKVSLQKIREDIQNYPALNEEQKLEALRIVNDNEAKWGEWLEGYQVKALFRSYDPLRFAQRAGQEQRIDTAFFSRNSRERDNYIDAHPEHLNELATQKGQARSFIRTWVILRKKPLQ